MSSSDRVSLYPHTGTAFALKPTTSSLITGEYLFNEDNFEEIRVMYGDMQNISFGSSYNGLVFDPDYPRLVNFTFNLGSNTANAHIKRISYRTKTYGNDSYEFMNSTLYYYFEDDFFPHRQISLSLLCRTIVSFEVETKPETTGAIGLGIDDINIIVMN